MNIVVGKLRFKKPYLTVRLLLAVLVIASVNIYGYTLWQEKLPWVSPFHNAISEEKETEVAELEVSAISASGTWTGQEVLSRLLEVFPEPSRESGWVPTKESSLSTGTVIDTACPAKDTYVPTLQKQQSWRYAGSSAAEEEEDEAENTTSRTANNPDWGLLVQVRLYKAGIGAVAFRALENQLSACQGENPTWTVGYTTKDSSIGAESFTVNVDGNAGDQEITFFRFGDLVGVVAERGYPTSSKELATDWESYWGKLLVNVCRNPFSVAKDASRQPFYKKYTGFLDTKDFTLPQANKNQVEADVTNAIYNSEITFEIDGEPFLPSSPSFTVGEELDLKGIPQTYLSIPLPAQPDLPKYPKALPKAPSTTKISGLAEDRFGPGCGWELAGQDIPPYSEEESARSWQESQDKAIEELTQKYREWFIKSWQKSVDYEKYVRDVTRWNVWTEERTVLISKAEWEAYDRSLEFYEIELPKYEESLELWKACERDAAYSTPTPVPAPTTDAEGNPLPPSDNTPTTVIPESTTAVTPDSSSYATAQCGPQPQKPIEPSTPKWTRPFVADPSAFTPTFDGAATITR